MKVTELNACETDAHRWVTEASTLRIRPGFVENSLPTSLGNGLPFRLSSVDDNGTVRYKQIGGCLTLLVFND